jgi:hypothetical protein
MTPIYPLRAVVVRREGAHQEEPPSSQPRAALSPSSDLARSELPGAATETVRYARLVPGTVAVFIHYIGPQVGDDGKVPFGGRVNFYLIETEEYQET